MKSYIYGIITLLFLFVSCTSTKDLGAGGFFRG